jgi:hypothetical protein
VQAFNYIQKSFSLFWCGKLIPRILDEHSLSLSLSLYIYIYIYICVYIYVYIYEWGKSLPKAVTTPARDMKQPQQQQQNNVQFTVCAAAFCEHI